MKEEWKFYKKIEMKTKVHSIEVSNEGNVKLNGVLIDFSKRHPTRYHQVHGIYVHRMVAELFIPNPEHKPFIDHIDNNRLNNHFTNLRWVTQTENMNNPITKKKMKDGWTEEVKKKVSESVHQYEVLHPEVTERKRQKMKEYYSDPENRKKTGERMKRVASEHEKWGGSYLKGCKYMTDGYNEVLLSPEYWGEFIDIGYYFRNNKYHKKNNSNII